MTRQRPTMKPKDEKILQMIRHNSRMNLTTMSRKTGIPVSTIFDSLKSYDGKLIKKFTAILDFQKLGYVVRAKVFLKIPPEERGKVKSYLIAHPNVNSVWRVNNGFDFAADCFFRDIRQSEDFLEDMEMRYAIADKTAYHVIEEIAIEKAMCGPPGTVLSAPR